MENQVNPIAEKNIDISKINELIEKESGFIDLLNMEIQKVIVGQKHMIESLLIGLLSNGHILLEGVPGLAKTLAISTLSKVINVDFKRVQFTPDLLPADLLGTMIYNQKKEEFISKFINFLRSKEKPTFPMILHAFEMEKSFLINLTEDRNLISPDSAREYIIQAINFLQKNNKTSFLESLKTKHFEGNMKESEKIEFKKILLENFENLDETEIKILRER